MGLAASQARLISLTARMSDLEYEGQQINQQRQTLTNKMTEVYNKAMDMDVPTPPSKIDYAVDGAYVSKNAVKQINYIPKDDGTFDAYRTITTRSLVAASGAKPLISEGKTLIKDQTPKYNVGDEIDSADRGKKFYNANGEEIEPQQPTPRNGRPMNEDVPYRFTEAAYTEEQFTNYEVVEIDAKTQEAIDNYTAQYGYDTDKNIMDGCIAIRAEDGEILIRANDGALYKADTVTDYKEKVTATASGWSNGTVSQFKLSDGTIDNVLPNGDAYDETAYNNAFVQYEVAKIDYDKAQNEFNKQTSVYQRQDKQLELKLTRLDNERNALKTEVDALKKVIQDASEKGFKTFSG